MDKGTPLGRVRGRGSAHSGSHHWLIQRFTAVGNLIALGWLLVSLFLLSDFSYGSMIDWLSRPVSAAMIALLLISTFWHARLGVQVMIEDYVHTSANKFAAFAALNLMTFAGAALGLLSIVRIALGAH